MNLGLKPRAIANYHQGALHADEQISISGFFHKRYVIEALICRGRFCNS